MTKDSYLKRNWKEEPSPTDKSEDGSANSNDRPPPLLVKPEKKERPVPLHKRPIENFDFIENPDRYISNLTFHFRNGDWHLFFYSNRISISYDAEHGILSFKGPTERINVKGRGLEILLDYLNQAEEEVVLTAIKESEFEIDDNTTQIHVESITVLEA